MDDIFGEHSHYLLPFGDDPSFDSGKQLQLLLCDIALIDH